MTHLHNQENVLEGKDKAHNHSPTPTYTTPAAAAATATNPATITQAKNQLR